MTEKMTEREELAEQVGNVFTVMTIREVKEMFQATDKIIALGYRKITPELIEKIAEYVYKGNGVDWIADKILEAKHE